MKVLNPQAALLTTAEIHQFLQSDSPRPADIKIGAYSSVNLHNHLTVRQDLESYVQATVPHILKQPQSETWMKDLIVRLKEYELTKTEVFSLINLGVGLNEASSPGPVGDEEDDQEEINGTGGEMEIEGEQKPDTTDGNDGDEDGEVPAENSLDRMLFGLVVEEADERFAGEDGEQRITEILSILKNTMGSSSINTNGRVTNGN